MSGKTFSDYELAAYNYDLPQELIASYPPERRGQSRLMLLDRQGQEEPKDGVFEDLLRFLPPKALLVANNSRVLPARLHGRRATGGHVELLLLTPLPLLQRYAEGEHRACRAECLLRSGGRIRIGETLEFAGGLLAEVLEKGTYGHSVVKLLWRGDLQSIFMRGEIPLPPYLRRKADVMDEDRYQTVYASSAKNGSVAAPTAGLHFTRQMRDNLALHGFGWTELTLYVGYGTFSPVRCQDIRQHVMHGEYVEISQETAAAIQTAKKHERPIVAIGTTSLRALEGVAAKMGELRPYSGWLDIFIYPGSKFAVVDGLLTNFHLPGSTLLMLVSAFAGREYVLAAYKKAVERKYRFFSYGDAMLIC